MKNNENVSETRTQLLKSATALAEQAVTAASGGKHDGASKLLNAATHAYTQVAAHDRVPTEDGPPAKE